MFNDIRYWRIVFISLKIKRKTSIFNDSYITKSFELIIPCLIFIIMINEIGANQSNKKNTKQPKRKICSFAKSKTLNRFVPQFDKKRKGQTIGKHKACQSSINNVEHALTQVPCYGGAPCHVRLSFKLTY